jgi:hypothetical protein
METTKISMSDYFCRSCHMPASIDDEGMCEFCRPRAYAWAETDAGVPLVVYMLFAIGLVIVAVGAWAAMKI